MRTLEEIKGRCFVTEDGHWLWRGTLTSHGRAHIYAPDYTRKDGELTCQSGARAVWHVINQKALPDGYRAYVTCDYPECCNPECITATTSSQHGKFGSRKGRHKGNPNHITANRAICAKRAKLTAEQVLYVQTSPKTGVALAAELGVSTSTISKLRRGGNKVTAPGGAPNIFTALMR